jgi:hypothetical protein
LTFLTAPSSGKRFNSARYCFDGQNASLPPHGVRPGVVTSVSRGGIAVAIVMLALFCAALFASKDFFAKALVWQCGNQKCVSDFSNSICDRSDALNA